MATATITNMSDAKTLVRTLRAESHDALVERVLTMQALLDAQRERLSLLTAEAPTATPTPSATPKVESDPAQPYLQAIADAHLPRPCDLASVRQQLNGKPHKAPNRATFRRLAALAQSHGYANTTADPAICAWLATVRPDGRTRYTAILMDELPDSEQPGFQRGAPSAAGQYANLGEALTAAYAQLG